MTLTLRGMSAGLAIALATLAASTLLLGNQRQAHAEIRTGAQINCEVVYPELNNTGSPIPHFPGDCQNPPPTPPQCSDGIDNDADGRVDYPADSGCSSAVDTTESPDPTPTPPPSCSNGIDDDGDTFTDTNDPNCHTDGDATNASSYTPAGTTEAGTLPACWNNIDDDEDGFKDFPADTGCTSATDTDETNTPSATSQCSDGLDNDSDSLTDAVDPACHTDFNAGNADSYVPSLNNEAASAPTTSQCSDGVDNDGDGLIDLTDPGCSDTSDNDETNTTTTSSGGENNSGSSGNSSGGGRRKATVFASSTTTQSTGIVLGVATDTPPVGPNESCDKYLTAFIKSGAKNDENQVRRLQYVLRDFEGAKIAVNGVYDAPTLAAVHAFQMKYAADILTPWGITESTGFTYLTTRKKVNEVYCRSTKQFSLTAAEQQTINASRVGVVSTSATPKSPTAPSNVKTATPATSSQPAPTSDAPEVKKGFWDRIFDVVKGVRPAPGSLWGKTLGQ